MLTLTQWQRRRRRRRRMDVEKVMDTYYVPKSTVE